MELTKLLRADYLDILFEGRNKLYGGYELRRRYASRSRKATAFVLLGVAIAVGYPVIAAKLSPEKTGCHFPVEKVTRLSSLPVLPKPLPVAIPEPHAAMAAATIPRPTFVITHDIDVISPPPATDNSSSKESGPKLSEGAGLGDGTSIEGPIGNSAAVVDMAPPSKTPVRFVEQQPAFNGDLAAFLRSRIEYPESARMAGAGGRSIIEFVVNEDGSISDVKVARSAGMAALDAEAMRVVRSMPAWKPGKQGGVPVKVYFNLPINFTLE